MVCYPIGRFLSPEDTSGLLPYLQGVLGKWFVWAYFGLYLFAPVLNDYIKQSDTRRLAVFVLAFYVFSTFFRYFTKAVVDFNEGMSVISLVVFICWAHCSVKQKIVYHDVWLCG